MFFLSTTSLLLYPFVSVKSFYCVSRNGVIPFSFFSYFQCMATDSYSDQLSFREFVRELCFCFAFVFCFYHSEHSKSHPTSSSLPRRDSQHAHTHAHSVNEKYLVKMNFIIYERAVLNINLKLQVRLLWIWVTIGTHCDIKCRDNCFSMVKILLSIFPSSVVSSNEFIERS